ncbi:unnamed protein product [Clavelina lepadiformis]|uniref:AP-3 complex subunit beta C-terminal domain-containing protein n=1 Tax=Clavelina lepadiformis TaxID=159417 RepID=A0ABP0FFP9_CLALP
MSQVPMARASILWLIGEYSEFVPKIAPDVLRKVAKSFTSQEDIVKLQIVNLASKLFVTNQKQTKLLTQYVLQLAKYDQNYDIRDRARFIRHLIMPSGDVGSGQIHKHAKKILLSPKPAPVLESPFKGRDVYQLGSLSHAINAEANGYQKMPDFPEEQPDPTVRNVIVAETPTLGKKKTRAGQKSSKKKSFYSDEDVSSDEEDSDESSSSGTKDSESDSELESGSEPESGSGSETEGPDSRVSDSDAGVKPPKHKPKKVESTTEDSKSESESDSDSESESDSSSEEEEESSSEEEQVVAKPVKTKSASKKPKKEVINLLDLDDFGPPPNASKPSGANYDILAPMLPTELRGLSLGGNGNMISDGIGQSVPTQTYDLLHRVTGEGLSAKYRYTRRAHPQDDKMISVELQFHNNGEAPIESIHSGEKKLQAGLKVHDFSEIEILEPGASTSCIMGIDFFDTTQPLTFDLCTKTRKFNVSIKIPVGELVKPVTMPQTEFLKQQNLLSGMNENKGKITIAENSSTQSAICDNVTEVVNVCVVPSTQDNVYRFAGKTAHGGSVLLVTVEYEESGKSNLVVNCDKMVICSMVFKQLKEKLS